MPVYASANLNMHKYALNMQKYAKICSDPISISPKHSYAFICTKYAKICKICKHEIYMQHMQIHTCPTLLITVHLSQALAQNKQHSPQQLVLLHPFPGSQLAGHIVLSSKEDH